MTCQHKYISFESRGVDGQAWWCDAPECDKKETISPVPGRNPNFPPNAYIRIRETNKYFWKTDEQGTMEELDREHVILRSDAKLESIL